MAGNQSAEWLDKLTRDDVHYFAEQERTFEIGRVQSDGVDPARDKALVANTAEGLLKLFEIDVDNWQERIEAAEGTVTSLIGATGDMKYDKQDVRRWAREKKLGDYILDRAYWAVPIEGGEDRSGSYELTLKLDLVTFATFKSFGEQEVYRRYIDIATGDELSGSIEDLEEKAMRGEVDTDIAAIHTDIAHRVAFSTELPQ